MKQYMAENPNLKYIFLGGKGGVGKTVLAGSAAIWSAQRGKRTLLASTNPIHSLSGMLDQNVFGAPTAVDGIPNLWAYEIDTKETIEKSKQEIREKIEWFLKYAEIKTKADRFLLEAKHRARLPILHPLTGDTQFALGDDGFGRLVRFPGCRWNGELQRDRPPCPRTAAETWASPGRSGVAAAPGRPVPRRIATNAAPGSYIIMALGNAGRSATATFTVTGTPVFSVSVNPSSLTLSPGGTATVTVTVQSVGSFNSPVTLVAGAANSLTTGVTTGTVNFAFRPKTGYNIAGRIYQNESGTGDPSGGQAQMASSC
jgi:hypothetical protein